MLKLLGLILLAGVAVLLILAARQPDIFRVNRSITIAAPAAQVFAAINDFQQWHAWSPYERLDPNMQRTISGAASGVGAHYEWQGDSKVGSGRMSITDSVPPQRVAIALDMLKPIEAHNQVTFSLNEDAGKTTVTWAMEGRTPFVSKIMHTLMDMDKMVGGQFSEGLANLKGLMER